MSEHGGGSVWHALARIIEAFPEETRKTFGDSVVKLASPATELAGGVGKTIKIFFDLLLPGEIELFEDVVIRVLKNLHEKGQLSISPNTNAKTVIHSFEEVKYETNEYLRELWSNLISQELLEGEISPIYVEILGKMTRGDAETLKTIYDGFDSEEEKENLRKQAFLYKSLRYSGKSLDHQAIELFEKQTSEEEHLEELGLIWPSGRRWFITPLGLKLLETIFKPE